MWAGPGITAVAVQGRVGGWGWGVYAWPPGQRWSPSASVLALPLRDPPFSPQTWAWGHWRSRYPLDISLFFRKRNTQTASIGLIGISAKLHRPTVVGGSDLESCFPGSAPGTGLARRPGGEGVGVCPSLLRVCLDSARVHTDGLRRWRLLSRKMGPDRTAAREEPHSWRVGWCLFALACWRVETDGVCLVYLL